MEEIEPPPPGILTFEVPVKPRSLQSRAALKIEVRNHMKASVAKLPYLLSGDVEVRVTWLVHEREQYYGVHLPDIDNILKPLLDGISGPEGVLVNDCQVQSVCCSWIDWLSDEQKLQFELRYMSDDWIRKDGLLWVDILDKLCMPLNSQLPPQAMLEMLKILEDRFRARKEILAKTGDYGLATMFTSVQRPFHRARLRGFKVETIASVRSRLRAEAEAAI
jgi:Holliday junction resolvase RusA-like endonuclease